MEYSRFIEPEEHYKAWLSLLAAVSLLVLGLFFLSQSRMVAVLLSPRPNLEEIRNTSEEDRKLQAGYRNAYEDVWGKSNSKIQFKFFEPHVQERLEAKTNTLLQDEQLQADLRNAYGADFRTITAIVAPGWRVMSPDNIQSLGLTQVAWDAAIRITGEPNVQGFTIRDQASIPFRLTTSGTPVIALNWSAFKSDEELKLTLFHEFYHALNINGSSSSFQLLQDDLTYLPHYRTYIDSSGLQGWKQYYIVGSAMASWAVALWLLFSGEPSARDLLIEMFGRLKAYVVHTRFSGAIDSVKTAK